MTPEMAQMDCQVPKSLSKWSQGCQMITGVILWHPWPVFAEFLSICAHLGLSVPFVSEMAQMDCQVPKSPYKCSQRCQRISRVILWHPWLHRNWWNLSILTHLCQIKLICAICVWHLCHLCLASVPNWSHPATNFCQIFMPVYTGNLIKYNVQPCSCMEVLIQPCR